LRRFSQKVSTTAYGFLLILLPGIWAVGSIWLETHRADMVSKRWTIVTGAVLFGVLAWMLFVAAMRGCSPPLMEVSP